MQPGQRLPLPPGQWVPLPPPQLPLPIEADSFESRIFSFKSLKGNSNKRLKGDMGISSAVPNDELIKLMIDMGVHPERRKKADKQSLRDWLKENSQKPQYLYEQYAFSMCGLQKIIYLLENNPSLLTALKNNLDFSVSCEEELMSLIQEYIENAHNMHKDGLSKLLQNYEKLRPASGQSSQEFDSFKFQLQSTFPQVDVADNAIRLLFNILDACIQKVTGEDLDALIARTQFNKISPVSPEHFSHIPKEQYEMLSKSAGYSKAEIEYRLLLHENIQSHGTSRFMVLSNICAILRPYRGAIKDIVSKIIEIGTGEAPSYKDARIKFRGSLVRGLKGYPKDGVVPTLDNYDCDAFIEVPEIVWDILKKHNTCTVSEVEQRASIKPLRDYEPLDELETGVSKNRPKPKTILLHSREQALKVQLNELCKIQENIRNDILQANNTGQLAGYSVKDGVPEFEFYLRPISSVTRSYEEGNPYVEAMISQRGAPALAATLPLKTIIEFEADSQHRRKRSVLTTFFSPDVTQPQGRVMPEIEVVVGKHGWYFEDQRLFQWRMMMRAFRNPADPCKKSCKAGASRRGLSFYSQEVLPLPQSPYSREKEPSAGDSKSAGDAKSDDLTPPGIVATENYPRQLLANDIHKNLNHLQSKYYQSYGPESQRQGPLLTAFTRNGQQQGHLMVEHDANLDSPAGSAAEGPVVVESFSYPKSGM